MFEINLGHFNDKNHFIQKLANQRFAVIELLKTFHPPSQSVS